MSKCVKWLEVPAFAAGFSLVVALAVVAAFPLYAANERFSVPDDPALRIRLDDTLTSVDSQIGDPFSATVLDKGDYQKAESTVTLPKSTSPAESKDRRAWTSFIRTVQLRLLRN